MALFSVVYTLWLPYGSGILIDCFSVFNLSSASIDDFRSCSSLYFSALIFSIYILRSYFLTSTFCFILFSMFANNTDFFLLPVSSLTGDAITGSWSYFSVLTLSLSPPKNSFSFCSVFSGSSLWLNSVDRTSPLFKISFYCLWFSVFSFLSFLYPLLLSSYFVGNLPFFESGLFYLFFILFSNCS